MADEGGQGIGQPLGLAGARAEREPGATHVKLRLEAGLLGLDRPRLLGEQVDTRVGVLSVAMGAAQQGRSASAGRRAEGGRTHIWSESSNSAFEFCSSMRRRRSSSSRLRAASSVSLSASTLRSSSSLRAQQNWASAGGSSLPDSRDREGGNALLLAPAPVVVVVHREALLDRPLELLVLAAARPPCPRLLLLSAISPQQPVPPGKRTSSVSASRPARLGKGRREGGKGTDRRAFSSSSNDPCRRSLGPLLPAIRSAIAPRDRRASRRRASSISRFVMSFALGGG